MEDIISQSHAIGHYIFISTDSVFMACDRVRVLAYQVSKMRHKLHFVVFRSALF